MAFVNFDRWMDLNPEEQERMGQRATAAAQPAINMATRSIGQLGAGFDDGMAQGRVADAEAKLKMTGNTGGIAALMSGKGQAPASAFDAALAGSSQALGGMRQRTGNLQDMLKNSQEQFAQRTQATNERNAVADAQRQSAASDASAKAEQVRLSGLYGQQRQWRINNYEPQGASEYAEYSDKVQNNRRPKTQSRSRNFFDFFGRD